MTKKPTHGGPGRGQGRHEEPGYEKTAKLRFFNEAEEELLRQARFTPRQRVEILLAALNDWAVAHNRETGRYVPAPGLGNLSYRDAKRECDRLNQIKADAQKQAKKHS